MKSLLDLSRCPPPGHRHAYERVPVKHEGLDKWAHRLQGGLIRMTQKIYNPVNISVKPIRKAREQLLQDGGLQANLNQVRYRLRTEGLQPSAVFQALALIDIACEQSLHKQAYDSQFKGAWAILSGRVAEMATGEGKSLTAALAVSVAALAGLRVHVVTVNDYLAKRDAEVFKPLYTLLELSVDGLEHEFDMERRSEAYHCDVLYCSNKELAFDYLKQRIRMGEGSITAKRLTSGGAESGLMPGLYFAIIDEADSVMVDEARTPLIISAPEEKKENEAILREALQLAHELIEDEHFFKKERQMRLTEAGEHRLEELTDIQQWPWCLSSLRAEIVEKALAALHVYKLGREYIVQDDAIQIVDEYTGRVLEGRSWEQGLHQLIELKEQVTLTDQNRTVARISYQQLFRKYHFLAGMTGTGAEVRDEFWRIYDLATAVIATRKKIQRQFCAYKILPDETAKWDYLAHQVKRRSEMGQPVLIGVQSINASEMAEQALRQHGLNVVVLNANQADKEAEIIAQAGNSDAITIATNMAGRGTDIALNAAAREAGGLHVVLTELHDASRIDRQLYGRCARQGDPGSYEMILSLDDNLPRTQFKPWKKTLSKHVLQWPWIGGWLINQSFLFSQRKIEKINRQQRFQLFEQSLQRDQLLAFTGKGD
ncbi:hypothetical protein [sulfur-oxidizing endosymbiont of Gigantopelta aegis]|uniref:preprotein translocase subunit SecA n=1 Tax=sulfur-oxidizing endosymbiont of Gigantopelta aegis TaxID=2794934 RepID=UPI0018DB4C02|nr:hypothetical protein [sulfur-oxidizing endosymbiont of Gigantopelta aegis]